MQKRAAEIWEEWGRTGHCLLPRPLAALKLAFASIRSCFASAKPPATRANNTEKYTNSDIQLIRFQTMLLGTILFHMLCMRPYLVWFWVCHLRKHRRSLIFQIMVGSLVFQIHFSLQLACVATLCQCFRNLFPFRLNL